MNDLSSDPLTSRRFVFYFQQPINRRRRQRAWSQLRHRHQSKYRSSRRNSWTSPPLTRFSGSTSDASWSRRCSPNGYWCPRAAPRPGTRSYSRPPTKPCLRENRRRNPWTPAWDSSTSEYAEYKSDYVYFWFYTGVQRCPRVADEGVISLLPTMTSFVYQFFFLILQIPFTFPSFLSPR